MWKMRRGGEKLMASRTKRGGEGEDLMTSQRKRRAVEDEEREERS